MALEAIECFEAVDLILEVHNFATRFQSRSLKGDGGYVQEVGIGNKDVFRDPGRAFR